jgi:hypothetical protein
MAPSPAAGDNQNALDVCLRTPRNISRQASHFLAFELRRVGGFLTKPSRPPTGIGLCSSTHNSFGAVVMIAKLRILSPPGSATFPQAGQSDQPRSASAIA